jgi:glycosyl transferase family 87
VLGSLLFVLAGVAIEHFNDAGMVDFKEYYLGSRCLLEHHDPFKQSDLAAMYEGEADNLVPHLCPGCWRRSTDHMTPNLPTTFLLVTPLAVLPWAVAKTIWITLTAGCYILAVFLMMNVGADYAPRFCAFMIYLFLINSELLLASGNAAGIVIGLSMIAAWTILRNRFALAGALCLALALVVKPHDAGLIWLYLLLAGGAVRKRALQSLAMAAGLAAAAALWTRHIAPHWLQELLANEAALVSPGGINDPGPASTGNFGVDLIISLQTIVSRFKDNPHFYNAVVFLICGALLLVWMRKTLRSPFTRELAWFALAAVVPLSMLFVYHRRYDARLLLLAVPACAILWRQGGAIAAWMLALNLAVIAATGDFFWIVLLSITHYQRISGDFSILSAPLTLLALATFSVWVYWRRAPAPSDAVSSTATLSP